MHILSRCQTEGGEAQERSSYDRTDVIVRIEGTREVWVAHFQVYPWVEEWVQNIPFLIRQLPGGLSLPQPCAYCSLSQYMFSYTVHQTAPTWKPALEANVCL